MKVLVTYASKHGSTAEIARHISEILQENQLAVTFGTIGEVNYVASYDAIIIGSALYSRQWMPAATQFLKTRVDILASKPTWLFSTGPTGEGIAHEMFGGFRFTEELQPYVDTIQPRDSAVFHGKLDLAKLSLAELQSVKNYGGALGDFRDWDTITAWAQGIVRELQDTPGQQDALA